MDKYLEWEQLSLIQQLNCVCDTLAKRAITTATLQGYHSRHSQFLPKEDVALVIWGSKVTGDISSPLRFHASKEMARQHLTTWTKDKWSNEKFDAVDWEDLDMALKNKPDMYKIWRSKQNSGFLGTRVQVGRYSGDAGADERCPNCGRQETAMHIMLCPDKDRTRLLIESVNELAEWMARDNKTDPEILYWIPKYILMRGVKPLLEIGIMSPQFKALARSQDLIGWREFTEGNISTHFYEIQSFHLAMSSNFLNGEDWTKQFISKLLQITHSQWIYRNVSLHDRQQGYLHKKNAEEIVREMEFLSTLAPEDIPKASRFLLEINFTELSTFQIETQKYWILAVTAACTAQELNSARGARAKRAKQVVNTRIASRKKLGIVAIEEQIRRDRMHQSASQTDMSLDQHSQTKIDSFTTKRPHPASITRALRSNKRLCKPD
jgi:hypothetical protein